MFEPGTIIKKPLVPPFSHLGLYLGDGDVLQNTLRRGPELVTLSQFRGNSTITIELPEIINFHGFLERVEEILTLSRPYNLLKNNCEHTVYYVLTGIARSPQLKVFIGTAIGAATWIIVARS